MLREGSTAPSFRLKGDDGRTHTLKEFLGKYVVLYFYPKDDTPGCTIEARDFTKRLGSIRKLGAEVVGISADDYGSHCKFRDKHRLKIRLLSDPTYKVIKAYGSYGDRGIFGKGTLRKTFIIDKDGMVVKDFEKVNAIGHADKVVEFLWGLKGK